MTANEKVGECIRAQVKFIKRTNIELSEALGVSHVTLYKLLRGESSWTIPYLESAAEFLECEIVDILIWGLDDGG